MRLAPKKKQLQTHCCHHENSAETPAAFVGIDWADRKHVIHVQPADGSAGRHEVIESNSAAITDWILKMRERFARVAISSQPQTKSAITDS